MIDYLRLIYPVVIGYIIFFILVFFIKFFINKKATEEYKKPAKFVCNIMLLIATILLTIRLITLTIINETPRGIINREGTNTQQNYEKNLNKKLDTTLKK
jgi:hypothetical protein